MTIIAGGRAASGAAADTAADAGSGAGGPTNVHEALGLAVAAPGSSEERVIDALLACVARWGLAKTTVEDVAREVGLSRATVYRLFPGGKNAMVEAALHREVIRLVGLLTDRLQGAADLEDSLVLALAASARFLTDNEALGFLREHEPDAVRSFLSFERLDRVFQAAGALLTPVLSRYLDPPQAYEVGIWSGRLVVSYVFTPSPAVDLTDEVHARRVVRTHLLPGIRPVDPPASSTPASPTAVDLTTSTTH